MNKFLQILAIAMLPLLAGCAIADTFVQGVGRHGNRACNALDAGDNVKYREHMTAANAKLREAGAFWQLRSLDCDEEHTPFIGRQ